MSAITIKLETEIVEGLKQIKPSKKSFSAFAREILGKEIRRNKLREAAVEYKKFLADNPEEREELSEWEAAKLDRNLKIKRR